MQKLAKLKEKLKPLVKQVLLIGIVSYVVASHVQQEARLFKPEEFVAKGHPEIHSRMSKMFPSGTNVNSFRFAMLQAGLQERDISYAPKEPGVAGRSRFEYPIPFWEGIVHGLVFACTLTFTASHDAEDKITHASGVQNCLSM